MSVRAISTITLKGLRIYVRWSQCARSEVCKHKQNMAACEQIHRCRQSCAELGQKFVLAHRVTLHDALKKAATDEKVAGPAAILHLGSGVAEVYPEAGTILLKDGTKVSGDAIIGADGVHSVTRNHVPGGQVKTFGSGKSAFRFLISRQSAQDDPRTRRFAEKTGELVVAYAADRRLVMYPTSNNTLLNFVCIHPESESDGSGDWNTASSVSKLLEVFANFSEEFRALLEKADPKTLKVWNLLDMEVIPTWCNGRLALIGDAAHPFLPHQVRILYDKDTPAPPVRPTHPDLYGRLAL